MAHPPSNSQNGIAPPPYGLGYHRQQAHPQAASSRSHDNPAPASLRPFTLTEALPYTPFTSVFPFEPSLINHPTIGSGSFAPPVADLVSHEDYDALNKEAESLNQSKRLEGSLDLVQNLLKANKITEFQFKTAPKASSTPNPDRKSLVDNISPFARMVYENTSIAFRHPTPETPKQSATANGQAMSPKTLKKSPKGRRQEPPKLIKHNAAALNAQAVAQNKARIEIHLPTQKERNAAASLYSSAKPVSPHPPAPAILSQPQTVSPADLMVTPKIANLPLPEVKPSPVPQSRSPSHTAVSAVPSVKSPQDEQTPSVNAPKESPVATQAPEVVQAASQSQEVTQPSSQKSGVIRIELPKANFNREEFLVVPDSTDVPTHFSEKRKRDADTGVEGSVSSELNQRDLANLAFTELRRCFQEIFSAQDQVTGQQGATSKLVFLTNEQEPTMTSAAHSKAQTQIKKAIDLGCFRQAPVNDLLRIQNLSEGSLKYADTLDFKIDEGWGETEVGFWVQQLPDIELGLRATRTSMRIMCGGREEKQLYSEDTIQNGLKLFRNVLEDILVPMAELRSTGPTASLFRNLSAHKKLLGSLFTSCQRLFATMSDLMASIDLAEHVVNALEFTASRLIFVENAYTEKDSVIGIQKFDGLRLVAMNMLSRIFLMSPGPQREGILNEILTSLEKLPVGKQNARQFKLSDGGSIQPVSALIMRLIQASAGKVDDHKEKIRGEMIQNIEAGGRQGNLNTSYVNGDASYTIRTESHAATEHSAAVQELQDLAKPLFDTANRNAMIVVNFIVKRALKSTKSGDTPYRNLLDLFVEDFTTCLDSPDWPAAELLLRLTMYMMFQQVDGDKNSAPARNMALELLGIMAASISRLRSHVRKTASNFEGSNSDELGRWLADLTLTALDGNMSVEKPLSWLGPYRIVLEYLQDRLSDDQHLKSAISYLVTDWGSQISPGYDTVLDEESDERDAEFGKVSFRLRNMIEDPQWLSREYSFKSVAANHAKLSYSVILLRSSFCSAFKTILNVLMNSMTTDQATVRSRSLKSINQVLETDPTILDGESVVIQLILQCSSDSSPQVRDSALGLIGKCINMRPRLEEGMTTTVIDRFKDSGVGVRKRAMKLGKDIYLRNESRRIRSEIANGLLFRTQDPDEGVRDLAKQMIEEIWISPFYKEEDSVAFKQSLTDHVALIVQTVKQGNTSGVLDKVFHTILSPDSRLSEANARVCTKLVANMFDLVDNSESEDPSIPSGRDALQVLVIFAKADPKLFTFEQIRLLKPHIASVGSNLSTNEDVAVSRAVVGIYCKVLPQVSSVHVQFLEDVLNDLIPATPKVPRNLLDEVIACLWIISGLIKSSDRLARLVSSSLAGVQKRRASSTTGGLKEEDQRRLSRFLLIVGMAGKHCNLDNEQHYFKNHFPKWQGGSVAKLMVDAMIYFASSSQPPSLRRSALDAVGLVCQSNPRNYVAANVYTTFQEVFEERIPALEAMVLRSFKEFLHTEELRSEQAPTAGSSGKEVVKKDLKVMGSTSFDDVASATTQRFLKEITRISLASQDDHAFLAMEVLASINRQGLVHPKETGVTLITLETCPVTRISELAYSEHKSLHEKYESVLEREYAKAIQSAFNYQRDVIKDTHGATPDPFTPKFHLLAEVLKISKTKNRTRFLEKFVGQLEFDPSRLDATVAMPSHLEYSRFLVENLAFFEYVTIGELQTTVAAMEKLVTGTGAGLAQTIESEIFQVRMDQVALAEQNAGGEVPPDAPAVPPVDDKRLRQLASSSIILLIVWEARTYLRRLYGLNSNRRESKGKASAKDLTKPPVRVQGVTGDKTWEDIANAVSGLATPERMMGQCRAFVELLNVDNEVKIADEEDDDADGEPRTPEGGDDDDDNGTTSDPRGRKRKAGNTPGGRKKRTRSNSKPRPRGRPRKQAAAEVIEVEMDADGDWV
ncbi:ARM repeat-containing protein [Xylariomycetidae sp. FL2044]|nr:ARM repeat-containing protein [Xylariomycetidae sp. FL2044]